MRIIRNVVQGWDGAMRLFFVVWVGAWLAALWILVHGGGSWGSRLWGAMLAAFAPALIAWPALARRRRRPASRPRTGSLGELEFLRRAGAI